VKKLLSTILLFGRVAAGLAADPPLPALLPAPRSMELGGGGFQLTPLTRLRADAAARGVAEYLAGTLRPATGFPLPVERASGEARSEGIWLTTTGADPALGPEGYDLTVTPSGVRLRAPTAAGLFYGAQTLRQLLPAGICAAHRVGDTRWTLPGVRIVDQPRFAWRGLMLDVSRHFFNKAEVEQLLDAMALLKLNTFHWHLVDDQGWRVEIKKYPQLTQSGAWRPGIGFGLDPRASTAYAADGRYGGYYTQADIREVVAYAQARFITIVPEIEMPGHSGAALAVCPALSCPGGEAGPNAPARSRPVVYCVGREETFVFLEDVLMEIMDLFPGKFIHVGGDEVSTDAWRKCAHCQARMQAEGLHNTRELQSYFFRRMEQFLNAHHRTLIGWSDIREGGLAPNAALMDWNGGATEAATAGHDVVLAPKACCYFDFYQSQDHATEPHAIGGFLPLAKVLAFEPIPPDLARQFQGHVLGAEGVIWSENLPNLNQVEFMVFPRLTALAEVVWSPRGARDFDEFNRRLREHQRRLDWAGVNYRRDTSVKVGEWTPTQLNATGVTLEWDVTKPLDAGGPRRVTFDPLAGADDLDIAWAVLLEDGREISRDEHAGHAGEQPGDPSSPSEPVYTLDAPAPKPGAHYTLRARLAGSGGTDSRGEVRWSLKPAP
jgi:hexosaminidase